MRLYYIEFTELFPRIVMYNMLYDLCRWIQRRVWKFLAVVRNGGLGFKKGLHVGYELKGRIMGRRTWGWWGPLSNELRRHFGYGHVWIFNF